MKSRGFTLVAALAAIALGGIASGCGDDEETNTGTTTAATGASGASGASGESGAQFFTGDIAEELESADFDVTEKTAPEDLEQRVAADGPVTAEEVYVAAKSGQGDVLVQIYADPKDARSVFEANNDDIVASELDGNVVVIGLQDNLELLEEARTALFE